MSRLISLKMQGAVFIGLLLEGFFYGLYSAIFYVYIQYHASREGIHMIRNILLYPLCVLSILSTAIFVLDITRIMVALEEINFKLPLAPKVLQSAEALHLSYLSTTTNGLCDFISQAILIYRCWIVWGCNIRVIIIPSILALAFLAIWLAANGSAYIAPYVLLSSRLGYTVTLTSLVISLIVNAVATGLIVFRILKVYWEIGPNVNDQTLLVGGTKAKLRSIIFIIIESGMAMFTVQLIRVVLTILNLNALYYIIGMHQMFNGIIPTIILLRVSMGLSYHDEKSMVETVTAASWRFASQNQNPSSEIGSIGIVHQEMEDQICAQRSDDIEIVDRCPT